MHMILPEPNQDPTHRSRPVWEGDTQPGPEGPLTRPSPALHVEVPPPSTFRPVDLHPSQPPRRRRRRLGGCWGCLRTVLAISAMALVALLGTLLIVGLVIYNSLSDELAQDIERLQSLEGVENFETSRIYDRDGVLLYEVFNEGRRTEVALDDIPFAMRWAIIATEDDSFYENPGFDPPSILRAAIQWYQEGEIVSGGSTITQQLVRQIVFDYQERNELTLRRKLKEAALAWVMTRQFTKDEILELYLNEVYYGNLAYGVEGAADVYFDKHASQLTIAEAAFLAGLVQSPVAYDPYTNFEAAKSRQRQVLDLMVLHGYLTPEEADVIFAQPPLSVSDLASPDVSLLAPHFTVEVRRQLAELPIDPMLLVRGGLEIYTTLDMDYQVLAEQIAAERVAEVREQHNLTNAALVAINPNTGEILAMLGSIDYNDPSIDGNVNIVLSPQQPGSTMKVLTYTAALEQGWTAADILWDVPMAYDTGVGAGFDYEPRNYDGRFHGPVRLRDALANSYNIPAVTMLRDVGVANLLEIAHRFGIESLGDDPAQYGLSLTLGGGEVTPLEMAAAFSALANGGRRVTPYVIARVVDSDGNIVYEAAADPNVGVGIQIVDRRIAFIISDILSDNVARTPAMGAASALLLDFPAAAKTGTTNDFRDNWTIGFTPHLVVSVWAGNTDNSPMAEGTSGLTGAAPIWHDFMTAVYERPDLTAVLEQPGLPPLRSPFSPPPGLEQRPVCIISGLRDPVPVEQGCPRTRLEWFMVGDAIPEIKPTIPPTPTPTPAQDEEGNPLPPVALEIERGVWVLGVVPLNEEQQAVLADYLIQAARSLPEGTPRPSAPRYCEVPPEHADLEGMVLQIFIAAPPDPVDAIRARNWALANGVPIVPGVPCSEEVIAEADQPPQLTFDPVSGATYEITSPKVNEEVYGVWPIIGTALFDPLRIMFYKVELTQIDGAPNDWVTLGETHSTSVVDSVLEYLHADALPPGSYAIRLVLVQVDGNFLQPFVVPIRIVPIPPSVTPSG